MSVDQSGGVASYRFSTDSLPERDRVPVWRESFGRNVMGLDMEPAEEEPLHFEITRRYLGNIAAAASRTSGIRSNRTPELLADGNSDHVLVIPAHCKLVARQRGRELVLPPGNATLLSLGETGCLEQPAAPWPAQPKNSVHIQLPREVLAPLVPDLDDVVAKVIPARGEALRLLRNYVGMLDSDDELVTALTAHSIASHILDLAVLAIGGAPDAMAIAGSRGLGAARLVSIKALIRARVNEPGLTVTEVAKLTSISPGYVRKLFAAEGTSFSHYLLDQRLARACRMLSGPGYAHLKVSDIAFGCGFGDLSYFNRAFRKRYGMTPSDARAKGREMDDSSRPLAQ